jgi:2-(1,2-epoxy-1,2-dihydrophenyl)acetyl-CoA isomerase
MGLIYKVFEDDAFMAETAALAARLAQGPALAYRLTKRAVRESFQNSLDAQLDLEAELQCEAGFSQDFFECVAAFRDKRSPRFSGC